MSASRDVLGKVVYDATPKQAEFHAAPEMYKLFGGAMGGGKSIALCAEGLALSIDYPGNRGYICRHEFASFKKTTGIALDKMLDESGLVVGHHQTDHVYTLWNGSTIMYGGLGDDRKAIEKLKSMELGWFAIDEASETTENFFLMLGSRLRLKLPGIRYFGLLASNPDPGWLKVRFIDRKRPDSIFIPALPRDNRHLPADYVKRLEELFPPEWQARFLKGDWSAFEGVNNVFPYSDIQAAITRELPRGLPVELGVDVARYGDDSSVIVEHAGPKAEVCDEINKSDLMVVTGRTAIQINERKPSDTKVDADGLGSGVVDRLRELGHKVSEIHGGAEPRNKQKFKNKKAEIYWAFRDRLVSGDVDLPDNLEMKAQLTSITYEILSSGQLQITPKEKMKAAGLKSPDLAEAVIYSFAPGAPTPKLWRVA